jgi:hypothetical protein
VAKLFFTTEKLGPKQSMTPEGYLLCEDVPIARTGEMIYGAVELMNDDESYVIQPKDGEETVRINREPEEVFRPETIASFNGKSVTDDHPESGEVSPETWKELTVGVIQHTRQGIGHLSDLLFADLLITRPDAIEAVRTGKREVSCGYQADYEDTGNGTGRQKNIIGNHVALVESGRCGWRCAIGDHQPKQKENQTMKMSPKQWLDKALKALKSKDEGALSELAETAPEMKTGDDDLPDDQHIHVHLSESGAAKTGDEDFVSRQEHEAHAAGNAAEHQEFRDAISAIKEHIGMNDADPDLKETEGQLEIEAPVGTGDKARKANDSAYMADSFQSTIATAEIIAPGMRVPTFDKAASPVQTLKKVCGHRRTALDLAYAAPATRGLVEDVLGGKALDTKAMSCDQVRTVFNAVGALVRKANNDGNKGDGYAAQATDAKKPLMKSVKDISKLWQEQNGQKA